VDTARPTHDKCHGASSDSGEKSNGKSGGDSKSCSRASTDLRTVYRSRVAAEWIRQRNAVKRNAFAPIIGSGDVSKWPARTPWNPRDVYKEYLKSYNEGDFTISRKYEKDGEILTFTYAIGGVDFAKSPRTPMPVAHGLSNAEIAERPHIHVATTKTHVARLLTKKVCGAGPSGCSSNHGWVHLWR
jgi:hypothetical protein